jgi:hypothetical protein
MRKVYFLAAAVAATLSVASCATSEVIDSELTTDEATPIGFGTFLDRVSRGSAAASPKAAVVGVPELETSGFTVLAYYTGTTNWDAANAPASPNFMDDQPVTWDGTSSWTYSPPTFWPRKDNDGQNGDDWEKLTFFAFSTVTDASADGLANSNPVITFTTGETAATQVDLVAATVANATGANPTVQFNFKHILSKIGFSTRLAADDGDATVVKVKSLKYCYKAQVNKKGSYTFSLTNDATADWTTIGTYYAQQTTPANGEQLFNDPIGTTLTTTATDLCAPDKYLMLIPQLIADGALSVELIYDVVTTTSGGVSSTSTTTFVKDLPAIAGGLQAGKAYTYDLAVSLTGVDFTVDVDIWTPAP